jgi:mRNA interferase RelE/StbE
VKRIWRIPEVLNGQITHLPPDLKRQVREAIDFIQKKPELGKPLSEELAGYRSYRIGRYRLIYRIGEERLILEAIGSRKDIYERMVLEIGRDKIRERILKSAPVRKAVRASLKLMLRRVKVPQELLKG